jgi:Yip1-like protein
MAALEDSGFGRLIGALVSPGKTFRSVADRPTLLVPLLLFLLVVGVVGFLTAQRTDYRDVLTQTMRERGTEVPPEQLERQIEVTEKVAAPSAAVLAPVVVAVIVLFAAFLYWLAFKLLGSDFSYKTSLSVALYAGVPSLVAALLTIPVLLSYDSIGFKDMRRTGGNFLQSNLAFLAPEGAKAWLVALCASADFFALWGLVLTVIGFKAASHLPARTVAVTVAVIWLLFVAARVGWAALFG